MDEKGQTRAGRAPHPVTGVALNFDLTAEAAQLMREETWIAHGHNAKTLVKHPDFRLVLIALKAGARMQEHKTDHCMTIHALAGRLRVRLPAETVEVSGASLLALEHQVPHDVEALEDSVFLLALGWSSR